MRFLFIYLLLLPFVSAMSQVKDGTLVCDNETFDMLHDLSKSNLSKGNILVFTTTHQDLGWLNHIDACIEDRDTLWLTPYLERLEKDPTFKMDIEQTSIVMEYLHRHPSKRDLFKKYIKEGRICVGATFIQPYEEMYAAESLARQFYFGSRWLKQYFDGYTSSSYFNVDVPGRTLQMPQIMQKAGIDNLVISRHKRGAFYWGAPDGSKVFTYSPGHYIFFYNILAKNDTAAIKEMAKESILWHTDYNDVKKSKAVMPAMLNYELSWDKKPVNNCAILSDKWNRIHTLINAETGKKMKVRLPQFKYAIADEFFECLGKSSSNLQSHFGERPNVWLYIHGPSHEKALTLSREGDVKLPMAEKMSSFLAMTEGNFVHYPMDVLQDAWKDKIYPDHGWNGRNGLYTDNTFQRCYENALAKADLVLNEQAMRLASLVDTKEGVGYPLVVFNTYSSQRDAVVKMSLKLSQGYAHELKILNDKGYEVPVQCSDIEYYSDNSIEKAVVTFVAKNMKAHSLDTYYVSPTEKKAVKLGIDNFFENEYYRIDFVAGGIKQIYDKQLKMNLLNTDCFLGAEVITMRSKGNGAGEFDAVQQPDMEGFDKTSNYSNTWEMIENGVAFSKFKIRTPIRDAVIEQVVTVYNQMKKIDFDVALLNWKMKLYREYRLMFPLAMNEGKVAYEVPYGKLRVGQDEMPGVAGERYNVENKLQHPRGIGNWLGASDSNFGVTLSSSVAVADYVDPTDNAVDYPILQPVLLASRKSCHEAGNEFIQPGDHFYHFSLTSDKDIDEVFGQSANEPLLHVYRPNKSVKASLPTSYCFMKSDNPNIVITTVKKCEDDDSIILRMYNKGESQETVNIQFDKLPKQIVRTNLIEEERETVDNIVLGKYAIETYKFKF